jgi:hypothetical protein
MTQGTIRYTLVALALAGCGDVTDPDVNRLAEVPLVLAEDSAEAPEGAAAGTCWARDRTPRVVETVTEEVRLDPEAALARNGDVTTTFQTRHALSGGGEALSFETPCADQMTADLTASLQRALAARRIYRGPVTGALDTPTRRAIRAWQKAQGLDSAILAMVTARDLGLIAYEREAVEPEPVAPAPPPARTVPADGAADVY